MTSARYAVFKEPNQPFELAQKPLPSCGPGEVLVEVSLATICASDLHTVDGRRVQLVSPAFPLAHIDAAFAESRLRKWPRVSIKP